MIAVKGIILILSCQKHLDTRIRQFKLPKNDYGGWKVIYVIGDLFLDSDYKFVSSSTGNASDASDADFLIVKCEDSYIHLLKKLVLSLKYLYETFDIKEGVLRSGDDLIYNEELLQAFLDSPKKRILGGSSDRDVVTDLDFYGKSPAGCSLLSHDISDADIKSTTNDSFMVNYYAGHQEDFSNPYHNLAGVNIAKYMKRPHIPVGPAGILYYISNKSCAILINHLNNINYDIFHYDEKTDSYPYTIEDCAVSFILYSNKIGFIHYPKMYGDYNRDTDVIAIHTNIYK
jgi:hypothetical protein